MRPAPLSALLGLILVAHAPVCLAQHPQDRHGFWLSISPGYGWTSVSCNSGAALSGCGVSGEHAVTGILRAGGTVSSHFLVGVEANSIQVGSHDPAIFIPESGRLFGSPDVSFTTLTGIVVYYPVVSSGFFLRGGAGLSRVEIDSGADVSKDGWAGLLGAGYDFRIARRISITPQASFSFAGLGAIDSELRGSTDSWDQREFVLSLGVTFH